MWASSALPHWFMYREREIGYSRTHPGGYIDHDGMQCRVNHKGLLRPWWIWEAVRGCCGEPCSHMYCVGNELYQAPRGYSITRDGYADDVPDWLPLADQAVLEWCQGQLINERWAELAAELFEHLMGDRGIWRQDRVQPRRHDAGPAPPVTYGLRHPHTSNKGVPDSLGVAGDGQRAPLAGSSKQVRGGKANSVSVSTNTVGESSTKVEPISKQPTVGQSAAAEPADVSPPASQSTSSSAGTSDTTTRTKEEVAANRLSGSSGGRSAVTTCIEEEVNGQPLEDSVRLAMLASFYKQAPMFSEASADGVRRWVNATEDSRKVLRMPHAVLMDAIITRFVDPEKSEVRATLASRPTWPIFASKLLSKYSATIQLFRDKQALTNVSRLNNESMSGLLRRIRSLRAEAYPDRVLSGIEEEEAMDSLLTGALRLDPLMYGRFSRLKLDKQGWPIQDIVDLLDNEDALKVEENKLWLGLRSGSVAPALQHARAIEAAGGQSQYMRQQYYQPQQSQQPQQLLHQHQGSQPRHQQQGSNPGQQQHRQGPVQQGDVLRGRCYHCGSGLHLTRDCTNGTKFFNCNQFGHRSSECPEP